VRRRLACLGQELEAITNFRGPPIIGDAGRTVWISLSRRGERGLSDRAGRGWFAAQTHDPFHCCGRKTTHSSRDQPAAASSMASTASTPHLKVFTAS
jgi:hypothetical protein